MAIENEQNKTEINKINKHLKVNIMPSHAIRMIKYKDTLLREESMEQSKILKIITAKCFTDFRFCHTRIQHLNVVFK